MSFRVVKQLGGFAKVRYRGLTKNLARASTMFTLFNLFRSADSCSLQEPAVRCEPLPATNTLGDDNRPRNPHSFLAP